MLDLRSSPGTDVTAMDLKLLIVPDQYEGIWGEWVELAVCSFALGEHSLQTR